MKEVLLKYRNESSKQILDQLVEICNGKETVKDSNIKEKKLHEFTETDKILYKPRKIKQASLKVEEARIIK
jgi:hypothetical protein